MRPWAWTISIGLHAALLALLIWHVEKVPAKPIPNKPFQDMPTRPIKLGGEDGHGLACAGHTYRGIGLVGNAWTDTVTEVGSGTPAEAAGFLAGDVLLEPNKLIADTYAPGTILQVPIKRNGRRMVLTVVIGHICEE